MQFAHLKLSNWRNFSTLDASLAPRMFIVGPNASGKSNLLDVFRFLRDIAKPGGGFRKAVTDRGGVSGLRCLAARRYSDIAIEVEVGKGLSGEGSPIWRYRIEFSQDRQRNPVLKQEQVSHEGKEILNRPNEQDRSDQARLTQTHLEQVNANKGFRALTRFFESVEYLHVVPHIIRDPERYMMRSHDPFGGDLLERLASTPEKTRNARLRKIQSALAFAVPQFRNLTIKRDERGTPHLQALYKHWRPQGAWQNERLFSDGTLRFLGFIWSLLDGQGPLLLEEPELSLHTSVVRRLARLIYRVQKPKGRQVFVSTHSYDLISDQGIGAHEVVLLRPAAEGTTVTVGKDDTAIRALLEAGATVADAVLPATEPKDARQLEISWG